MGLFSGIKAFFNERQHNHHDQRAIAAADSIDALAGILNAADERIQKYKLVPISKGTRPSDDTFFESGLGALRTAARTRAITLGMNELAIEDGYKLVTSMTRQLDDTIASVGRDLMTSNAGYSIAATASIEECHEKIKSFVTAWHALPEHVRATAPNLRDVKNPNSDKTVQSDGLLDVIGTIIAVDGLNMFSRMRLQEDFKQLRLAMLTAQSQMESTTLTHLAQANPREVALFMSAVVPATTPQQTATARAHEQKSGI